MQATKHLAHAGAAARGERFPRAVAVIGGATFGLFGAWALVAPRAFFDAVATFHPYNQHFIHDIGAFQLAIGVSLFVGALARDGLFAALTGAAAGAAAHLMSHVVDRDLGGSPTSDIPFFSVLALLLAAAAVSRATHARSSPDAGERSNP